IVVRVVATNSLGSAPAVRSAATGLVQPAPPVGSRRPGAPEGRSTEAQTITSATKVASVFSVGEAGQAVRLNFYARWASGLQSFTGAIYAVDATGQPTALLGTGGSVTLGGPEPEGFSSVSLPNIALTPGRYAVAVLENRNGGVWRG